MEKENEGSIKEPEKTADNNSLQENKKAAAESAGHTDKSGNAVNQPPSPPKDSPVWDFSARIFPWVLALLAFLYFHKEVRSLATSIEERVRLGAPLKVKDIEIGAIKIELGTASASLQGTRPDDGTREKERSDYYDDARRIMLVHTIARSRDQNGSYDIRIFVIPHNRIEDPPSKMVSLAGVSRVEYYFGGAWGNLVFPSQDRASNFAVAVSAYGPFLATAHVVFNDGHIATLHRYIDFEMGNYAPVTAAKADTSKSE